MRMKNLAKNKVEGGDETPLFLGVQLFKMVDRAFLGPTHFTSVLHKGKIYIVYSFLTIMKESHPYQRKIVVTDS
ncbi:MAG: hypothetical protein KGY80_10305 [Candidatus Thorarchaeota archaeon]|nr:hypothetical protein [Candidatus Thorarchaeota archaeon]